MDYRMIIVALALGVAAPACKPQDDDSADDDDAGDDDSIDDDAGDDDTYEWPGTFAIVRICGADGGDPADPGPDLDALTLRRDAGELGNATSIQADGIAPSGNGHDDPNAALGAPDEQFVAVGGPGHYLDLRFAEDVLPGDVIVLWEVTDGSGEDETYRVLVSADGIPGHWVRAGWGTGTDSVSVSPPDVFHEGCED